MEKWFTTGFNSTEGTAEIRKAQGLPIGSAGGICYLPECKKSIYCASNIDKFKGDICKKTQSPIYECELALFLSR